MATPAPPTCNACGSSFEPNGTLLSLPDGRRFAFAPADGRAWRICTHCGEWDLIDRQDPEALAELDRRFSSAVNTGDRGYHTARPNDYLRIVRVGTAGELLAVSDEEAAAARHKRWFGERGEQHPLQVALLIGCFIGLFLAAGTSAMAAAVVGVPACVVSVVIRERARGLRHPIRYVVMAAAALVVIPALLLAFHWASIATMALGIMGGVVLGRILESESDPSQILDDLDRAMLPVARPSRWWKYDNYSPEGLRMVLEAAVEKHHPTDQELERGYALVRVAGGLAGLANAIRTRGPGEASRPLPPVAEIALDMAYDEFSGKGGVAKKLRREALGIALEAGPSGPHVAALRAAPRSGACPERSEGSG